MHNDKKFKMWKSKKGFNDTFFIFSFLLIKFFLGLMLYFVAKDLSVSGYSDFSNSLDTDSLTSADSWSLGNLILEVPKFLFQVFIWNFNFGLFLNAFMLVLSIMICILGYRLLRGQS